MISGRIQSLIILNQTWLNDNYGLKPNSLNFLLLIASFPGLRAVNLIKISDISEHTLNQYARNLLKKGLITGSPYQLTTKGWLLYKELNALLLQQAQAFEKILTK